MKNQQRSTRGSLSAKAKEALFSTFGENNLPSIKSSASPTEIAEWKQKEEVANCYDLLFKQINPNTEQLYVVKILEKVFPSKETTPPNIQVAYVVAICTAMLNPAYESIQLGERLMKKMVSYYLVSVN